MRESKGGLKNEILGGDVEMMGWRDGSAPKSTAHPFRGPGLISFTHIVIHNHVCLYSQRI